MNDTLELRVISQECLEFSGTVEYVSLPAVTGFMGVLPKHAPVIAQLKEGVVSFRADGEEKNLPVNGGFAELSGNTMTILK